jgi:hypothetical protein
MLPLLPHGNHPFSRAKKARQRTTASKARRLGACVCSETGTLSPPCLWLPGTGTPGLATVPGLKVLYLERNVQTLHVQGGRE